MGEEPAVLPLMNSKARYSCTGMAASACDLVPQEQPLQNGQQALERAFLLALSHYCKATFRGCAVVPLVPVIHRPTASLNYNITDLNSDGAII